MKPSHYQVKEVAELSGVSVRTLHHYDRISLLVPSARSSAGYRLYSAQDLLRLQQVLVQRELGLSLEAIRKLLDDPAFDHRTALLEQRRLLLERAAHTAQMIRALDNALSLLERGSHTQHAQGEETMTDMQKLFDGFDPAQYEQEAKERWGKTEAYRESQRRTQQYTQEDWQRYKAEAVDNSNAFMSAMAAGKPADDPAVMDLAEQHRLLIDRWFYPCSHEMHARLADMYEADPRFAQNIDKAAPGLTPYLSAAIRANTARNG